MNDQHWRTLLKRSLNREEDAKMTEEEVRDIFNEIDKDFSGEITKKVR